ncbi:MAG: helix-turn-helix domain-containing protein, partial [Spirochaetota bacterium]
VVENMVILTKENILDIQHIPQNIISEVSKRSDFILNDEPDEDLIKIKAGIPLEEVEKIYLLYLLDKYKNKAKVAQISGIGRKTLYNKLEKWGVPLDKSEA